MYLNTLIFTICNHIFAANDTDRHQKSGERGRPGGWLWTAPAAGTDDSRNWPPAAARFEVPKCATGESAGMQKLIIHGDPGIRKGARIEYDGEEYVCFSVARQGDWHGPTEPKLWCTVGGEDEQETFERREYIPMHLDTKDVAAGAVTVLESS